MIFMCFCSVISKLQITFKNILKSVSNHWRQYQSFEDNQKDKFFFWKELRIPEVQSNCMHSWTKKCYYRNLFMIFFFVLHVNIMMYMREYRCCVASNDFIE